MIGLIVTLLADNDCVVLGCAAVVLVLEMLTRAGVGIKLLLVFVKLAGLSAFAGSGGGAELKP